MPDVELRELSCSASGVAVAASASSGEFAERAPRITQREERRANVVAPLRDAVRFVHDEPALANIESVSSRSRARA